jgi:hypothetical protein
MPRLLLYYQRSLAVLPQQLIEQPQGKSIVVVDLASSSIFLDVDFVQEEPFVVQRLDLAELFVVDVPGVFVLYAAK